MTFIVERMGGHAKSAERQAVPPFAVDLVTNDELALTPVAATALARIVRARVEARSESTISCHSDEAHSKS